MMRRDGFWFDGGSSLEYQVWITGAQTERTPRRDVTAKVVPGRNGALLLDNGRWENVEVVYRCAILRDFTLHYGRLMGFLGSRKGYFRLADTMRQGQYRMAAFRGAVQPENTPFNRAGEFELVFDCDPRRFLSSGDNPVMLTAPVALFHPTDFPAQPVITVRGSGAGVLTVGGKTVEILTLEDEITIDCEQMDAHRQGESRNSDIYAPEFPELLPGRNEIAWDGGISSVEVVPRWWTL